MSVRLLMSDWIGQSEPHYLLDLPVRHWISYPKIMVFTLTRDIRSGSRGAVLPDQNVTITKLKCVHSCSFLNLKRLWMNMFNMLSSKSFDAAILSMILLLP
ncbi:hypothetical protein Tco_0440106 [Tanacetum coccineum]